MHAVGHFKVLVLDLVEFPEGHGLSVFLFDAFRQIQAVHKQPNDERRQHDSKDNYEVHVS